MHRDLHIEAALGDTAVYLRRHPSGGLTAEGRRVLDQLWSELLAFGERYIRAGKGRRRWLARIAKRIVSRFGRPDQWRSLMRALSRLLEREARKEKAVA